MSEPTPIFKNNPDMRDALVKELNELDTKLEPLQRRAEDLRRALGIIGTELGLKEK